MTKIQIEYSKPSDPIVTVTLPLSVLRLVNQVNDQLSDNDVEELEGCTQDHAGAMRALFNATNDFLGRGG